MIAIVQPYKQTYMNTIDSLILAVISLFGILYILYFNLGPNQEQHSTFFLIALCLNFTLPLFGFVIVIIFKIFKNKIPANWIYACNKTSKTDTLDEGDCHNEAQISPAVTVTTTKLELPDRILHPYHYVEKRSNDTKT